MTGPAELPGPIVDGHWLSAHLDAVRVVDVRWYLDGRSGRKAWADGHIPGAVWLDIDHDLSAPPSPEEGRHPLPTPEDFAAALGRAGIAAGTPVIAYDDAGGSIAARLWWMLHVLDEPIAVLDGGIDAWPGARDTDEPSYPQVEREPTPWPTGRFVTATQVALAEESAIFDARSAERYVRGQDGVDPRPGHVPGAISAPWAGNLDETGRFRPADELREQFAAASDRPAIAYCGSGVTACHDLLAMEIAGIGPTSLYTGSWSQWGAEESRPAETG